MDFNEYQRLADRTRSTELSAREALAMTGLGISGEAGECAKLIKKHLYHGHPLDKEKLVKELGDVLWYVAVMALENRIELDVIARTNIQKLQARYPNGFTTERSLNRTED